MCCKKEVTDKPSYATVKLKNPKQTQKGDSVMDTVTQTMLHF